jgi:hypothetical protein
LLTLLDLTDVTATVTRGIFTLDVPWHWFWAGFFVVAINMTVLVTARTIVHNGVDRFLVSAPERLHRLLTDASPRSVWTVLGIVHIFTVSTVIYLLAIAHYEGETIYSLPLLCGLLTAVIFWYLTSLFYYWSYRSPEQGQNAALVSGEPAALIFPKYDWLFGDIAQADPPPRLMAWIGAMTRFLLHRVSFAGYAASAEGPVWELHFLAGISLAGIFSVYLFLYPLTSPVLRSIYATIGQISFCIVLTVLFLWSIADTGGKSRWGRPVKRLFTAVALSLAAVFVAALTYDWKTDSVRLHFAFPTIASILVLLGFLLWLFAGAAFFLDRYRIPVLTIFLGFVFLPKMVSAPLSACLMRHNHPLLAEIFDSDHYFSVVPQSKPIDLHQVATPYDVLRLRVKDRDTPYIVVTASGGGIQAAAWTAEVMARLEQEFATNLTGYTFHDHILLASGVSGGSDGLMPFLLEYTAEEETAKGKTRGFPAGNQAPLYDRITKPPACSSLEAVGWGLSYHDFYRLMLPVAFPRPLDDDDAPDRSWALASAFNRNLHDRTCGTEAKKPTRAGESDFTSLPQILDGKSFTLGSAAQELAAGRMPAFTFNTTVAETGGRFLLSNYYVPSRGTCGSDFTPAESFLQVYGADPSACFTTTEKPKHYADLSLATAARLSATFPLVSSGTRIPLAYTRSAYHFLDGGYFDNDGTSSAIEFLKSALDDSPVDSTHVPRRILWIEIRDDDGRFVGADADDLPSQNGKGAIVGKPAAPWTPLGQLSGVAEGLWNAGHVSVSRRNRRELCLFEQAYHGRIEDLHHVVFTIPPGKDHLSPLSWNLTKGQEKDIGNRADAASKWIRGNVVRWVTENRGKDVVSANELCHNNTEPAP